MGFLTGSLNCAGYGKTIKVLDTIEYIKIDPENGCLYVSGDFLARNVSRGPARLSVVYGGNVDFVAATSDWLHDGHWTPALLEVAGDQIGLGTESGSLFKHSVYENPLEVKLLDGPTADLHGWSSERPEDGRFVPFTGFDTPEIEPGTCCLFRVDGIVTGGSYQKLFQERRDEKPIVVTAGLPLLETMKRDAYYDFSGGSVRYRQALHDFRRRFFAFPEYHHFFLESADGRPLDVRPVSTDLQKEEHVLHGDGRCITWIWSDSDFNLHGGACGPMLEINVISKSPNKMHKFGSRSSQ